MSNAFTDGRRFRVLAIVDDFSHECLALVADTSLSGLRVTRELNDLIQSREQSSVTMVPNSPAWLFSNGANKPMWSGTILNPANPNLSVALCSPAVQ